MKVLLYRFFLNPTDQPTLFKQAENKNDRIMLLKKTFRKNYRFTRGKSDLGYVFERSEENYFFCKFGRRSTQSINRPPEEDFKQEIEDSWPYSNLFIRLDSDHENGQVIAIEQNKRAFPKPINPLQALTNKINEGLSCDGYVLSIHPVTTKHDFWAIIKSTEDKIQELTFSFSVPNLFNLQNKLNEDLKKIQKDYNATEASMSLANPSGKLKIKENNKLIKQSVEYITEGGGEYKIKAYDKRTISSKDKSKYRDIDLEVDLNTSDKKIFMEVLKEITKL